MPRRAAGTGSLYQDRAGNWFASLSVERRIVRRRRPTRGAAEAALADLFAEYADRLGYAYARLRDPAFRRFSEFSHVPRPRAGVTLSVRWRVLERDEHRCRYCGARAPEVELVIDHVVPVARGGTDDLENLAAACKPCNGGKAASELRLVESA